jgi:hypothetical protein
MRKVMATAILLGFAALAGCATEEEGPDRASIAVQPAKPVGGADGASAVTASADQDQNASAVQRR